MRKSVYVFGAFAMLSVGSLILSIQATPPVESATTFANENVRLSETARAIHEDVTAKVAALQEQPTAQPSPSLTDKPTPPDWLQDVIDQGHIDERYADLFLRDDYLDAVQEQFHVLKQAPLAPEEENCDRQDVEYGRSVCWNRWSYEPYFTYELATLQSMAESDPVAAATLAIRMEDEEARLYYAVRATRLSGKPGPLVRYLTMHADASAPQGAGDALLRRYALALIVDEMGYPYRYSVGLANDLERAEIPREEIESSLVAGFTLQTPRRIGQ